jgi:hypothetical protein
MRTATTLTVLEGWLLTVLVESQTSFDIAGLQRQFNAQKPFSWQVSLDDVWDAIWELWQWGAVTDPTSEQVYFTKRLVRASALGRDLLATAWIENVGIYVQKVRFLCEPSK